MKAQYLVLAALAGLAPGCNDSTAPRLGEGTFVLRTVAGEGIPARVRTDQFGGQYLADTIRFEPRSLAIFAGPTLERIVVEELPAGGIDRRVEFVAYDRDGDDFQFSYPCGDVDEDCGIGLATGSLDGDRLEVIAHPSSGWRSPLVYERIP